MSSSSISSSRRRVYVECKSASSRHPRRLVDMGPTIANCCKVSRDPEQQVNSSSIRSSSSSGDEWNLRVQADDYFDDVLIGGPLPPICFLKVLRAPETQVSSSRISSSSSSGDE